MADKEKEILLTKDTITMNFDLTEKGQERRPENLSRVEVEVYERANKHPVFVVYERNDSPQRYTPEQRNLIIDWAIETYKLYPAEVNFYEKNRDAEQYHPVRAHQLGYEEQKHGLSYDGQKREVSHNGQKVDWSIETRADDSDISKKELAGIIGYRDFTEPDLGLPVKPGPKLERPDPINKLTMPQLPPGAGNDHPIDP